MKKILHIVSSLDVGGLEQIATDFFKYADNRKYDVNFLVINNECGEREKQLILEGAKIFHLRSKNKLYFLFQLCAFLKDNGKYDVIHSHVFFFSGVILFVSRLAGVHERIAHSHSNKRKPRNKRYELYAVIMRLFLKCNTTKALACSIEAGEFLFGKEFFQRKGIVWHNTICIEEFLFSQNERSNIRDKYGISDSDFVIGQVANFTQSKNHSFLLDLLATHTEEPWKLMLVGDGILREEILNRIKQLNIEEKVILTGTQKRVGPFLSAMDIFVTTSTNEGFGISIIEALSNGLEVLIEKNTLVSELYNIERIRTMEGFNILDWKDNIRNILQKERHIDCPANIYRYDCTENENRIIELYN